MKTLFRREYNQLIVAMLIFFGFLAIVSSVSACSPTITPEIRVYDFDAGQKTFNVKNNKYHVSWASYRNFKDKNATVYLHAEYKVKNKKNKIVFKSNSTYTIEKIKKNRIKVTITYSKGHPNNEMSIIYKTKLNVKTFSLKYIKNNFRNKYDKMALYKESVIDKGKIEVTFPDDYFYKGKVKHTITWKTKVFQKFPNILHIEQYYTNEQAVEWNIGPFYQVIKLEKTKKNKIKITISDIRKVNGKPVKDRIYMVKTKLSVKKYYSKVFKQKMIKLIS